MHNAYNIKFKSAYYLCICITLTTSSSNLHIIYAKLFYILNLNQKRKILNKNKTKKIIDSIFVVTPFVNANVS